MSTAIEILQANGVRRPAITVAAAQQAGLELAAAAVVVMAETSGGQMIWGHDGSPTARRTDQAGNVIYTFGGPVTEANYRRFRAEQRAGRIPRQGVGDCQLTSETYIARAETIGPGPWDPYCNQLAGFTGLAALIRDYGDRDGFRRYNGSGAAAEAYAVKRMVELGVWRSRLKSANAGRGADGLPTLSRGDQGPAVMALQRFLNAYAWRPALPLLPVTGLYGDQTVAVVKAAQKQLGVTGPDADGTIVGDRTNAALYARGYRG